MRRSLRRRFRRRRLRGREHGAQRTPRMRCGALHHLLRGPLHHDLPAGGAALRPDVLVKGAEYGAGEIVGEDFLEGYGGRTVRFPMQPGQASSTIIGRIESSAEDHEK